MHSSVFLFTLYGSVVARPVVDDNQVTSPSWPGHPQSELPQGDLHEPLEPLEYWNTEAELGETSLPFAHVTGAACGKVFKALKSSLNPRVPNNKLLPWQPDVPLWWKNNQNDLLQQIVVVHKVASDDFDDYVMWVANHPNVPDDQKNASYLAAQRILDVVKAAKIDGPWGAFHLVTRVAKWLLLNPKPVNKWKKACFQEEFSI